MLINQYNEILFYMVHDSRKKRNVLCLILLTAKMWYGEKIHDSKSFKSSSCIHLLLRTGQRHFCTGFAPKCFHKGLAEVKMQINAKLLGEFLVGKY